MARGIKRRGLATVVTTGILLSAVAVMGSMLTAWSNSIFANEQHDIGKAHDNGINKLNEFLVVEHVWFGNNQTKFVNMTMSNVGNVGLNVTKITLDNSIDKLDLKITDGGIERDSYKSKKIFFNWTSTEPIKISILTEKGSLYQTYVMGP